MEAFQTRILSKDVYKVCDDSVTSGKDITRYREIVKLIQQLQDTKENSSIQISDLLEQNLSGILIDFVYDFGTHNDVSEFWMGLIQLMSRCNKNVGSKLEEIMKIGIVASRNCKGCGIRSEHRGSSDENE